MCVFAFELVVPPWLRGDAIRLRRKKDCDFCQRRYCFNSVYKKGLWWFNEDIKLVLFVFGCNLIFKLTWGGYFKNYMKKTFLPLSFEWRPKNLQKSLKKNHCHFKDRHDIKPTTSSPEPKGKPFFYLPFTLLRTYYPHKNISRVPLNSIQKYLLSFPLTIRLQPGDISSFPFPMFLFSTEGTGGHIMVVLPL